VKRRLRSFAAVAVASALLAQTWLWIGLTGAPTGYTVDLTDAAAAHTQFFLGGRPGELGPAGGMTIRAGPYHFEQGWQLANGGAVHISQDVAPYSFLFREEPSHDQLIAAVRTRSKWKETSTVGGVNALTAKIGRVVISIEGPLSYEELFQIARSLRPGYASLLHL
jgi:hypothetical protein